MELKAQGLFMARSLSYEVREVQSFIQMKTPSPVHGTQDYDQAVRS